MITLAQLFFTFGLAVLGYVICIILMDGEELLSRYDDLLIDLENYDKRFKWITKPLGRCEKCFTGQLVFWSGLKIYAPYCRVDLFLGFLELAILTAYGILFVMIIKKIFKQWSLKK